MLDLSDFKSEIFNSVYEVIKLKICPLECAAIISSRGILKKWDCLWCKNIKNSFEGKFTYHT